MYISLNPDKPKFKAKIGSKMTDHKKELFTNFLQDKKDVFAWSTDDILGIDHFVICYRLHLDPTARPVIQCKRNHITEQSMIIKDEIDKVKDINFIMELYHPDLLANVVLV